MKFVLAGAAIALSTLAAAGSASAADLPDYVAPPVAVAPAGWDGWYAGVVGAYAWGNSSASFSAPGNITNWQALGMGLNGGLLGATLGFNFATQNNFVLGIEGDVSAGRIGGTGFMAATGGLTTDPGYNPNDTLGEYHQSYFATLRARLGWSTTSFGNPTLWYLTGGLAASSFDREISNVSVGDSKSSATHTGWTVGGGFEHLLASNWSLKAEVLYADLGTQHYNGNLGTVTDVHVTDTLFRVGFNKHF
jgi:outer membrane immunogenic protein